MKKLTLVFIIVLILTAIFPTSVFAINIGDKLGNVLNTDIKTYINGQQIPCYNIGNNSIIIADDLINYGFDSVYNDNTRTLTITRNYHELRSYDFKA